VNWFLDFKPILSTDVYLLLEGVLMIMFLFGLISPRFNYTNLSRTSLFIIAARREDRSIARTQCSVTKFQTFLVSAFIRGGTLVIRRNDQVLATIPHIPFLSFRMPAIEHLLETQWS
jgi:hypothetical protein